ncbi:uncharacterized protein [Blastocystis hominis]|uniref:26S proteasome complex subunit DSS1 n=1 Tax=Blastocystis hominis TaxID=12968 RepID=D8M0G2_BLAHO|nr:uncharacterized protein [Blastocystis hominis]CBK21551.2 unnamed protein product [Blastocystis hominis]|eukprot:XP_012895599.1 uncharacterized protein [Blastocystis hominis]
MSTNQKPENKETFNLERAEEDDEFEEFEKDDWMTSSSNLSLSIHWEDNWDSANVNDDFCTQLRAELDKAKTA